VFFSATVPGTGGFGIPAAKKNYATYEALSSVRFLGADEHFVFMIVYQLS